MIDKKVIIAGCTKNSGQYILAHLIKLGELGKQFSEYKIIIYENDSSDNTIELLELYKKSNKNFIYISEKGISTKYSPHHNRVQIITHGRNYLLTLVYEKYSNYDLLIMVDLDDVLKKFNAKNCAQQISRHNDVEWSGLTANCEGPYYDIWALRIPATLWDPEIHGKIWPGPLEHDCWNQISNNIPQRVCIKNYQKIIPLNMPLIETESSFNGIGVYKIDKIKDIKYDAFYRNQDNQIIFGQCEHVSFHRNIRNNGGKIYICPSLMMNSQTEHIQK